MEFQVRRWNWKTILIGTAGVFVRRNLITILLSIEIMLNAVNLTFVAFGRAFGRAASAAGRGGWLAAVDAHQGAGVLLT